MTVPVPAVCSAIYAVMTPQPLDQEDHVVLPHEWLLRLRGSSDLAIRRLSKRPYQRIIKDEATSADAAPMALQTRKEALRLAEDNDGVVIDMLLPRIIETGSDATSLEAATQWFVFEYDVDAEGHVMTHGLDQFGLPELHAHGVPSAQRAMYDAVLTGLAYRLIREWPEHDPAGPATVTLQDIAFGYGDPEAAGTPSDRSVNVTLTYQDFDQELSLTLHDDPALALFQD